MAEEGHKSMHLASEADRCSRTPHPHPKKALVAARFCRAIATLGRLLHTVRACCSRLGAGAAGAGAQITTASAAMADPEQVGKAFLQYYYQLFESNRAGLATLYQDASMLTFEGAKFQGAQAIVGKLAQLPFAQCKVSAGTMDFQPSVSGGILVFVTGQILPEGETNPLKFSQVFHLMPVNNSFVVTNDLFRLNY